jgi:hypothetical protein
MPGPLKSILLLLVPYAVSWGQLNPEWDVASWWCSPSSCAEYRSGVTWQTYMTTGGFCGNGSGVYTYAGYTANCLQQALGDAHGYYATYITYVLVDPVGWLPRVIGGNESIANGTVYDGRSSQFYDRSYCDGVRDTEIGPIISPC